MATKTPVAEKLTTDAIYTRLNNVMDPELGISIVKLGLIYDVSLAPVQDPKTGKSQQKAHIVMTLTTPGCPLAAVFEPMVKDALFGLPDFDPDHDLTLELTFDPPWVPDMMDPEAKAELGFD
jgi:metal-sulfur cluster biosynthetic enzyme